jgi:hypothetical protein
MFHLSDSSPLDSEDELRKGKVSWRERESPGKGRENWRKLLERDQSCFGNGTPTTFAFFSFTDSGSESDWKFVCVCGTKARDGNHGEQVYGF